MTIRDIAIAFGYEIDRNSETRAEGSINSLKNMARKALGAIGIAFTVSGIKRTIQECVDLASTVEEMENKFNVVFGEIGDEVDAWAQQYSDAIGRNKNDIKSYLADQQNLLVGFGMTREEGAKLSEEMTSLALDISSFANIDEGYAVNYMTKAVMGESEAAKMLGAVLNDVTRAEAMHTLGMSGSYDSLSQLKKMQVNYNAILSQSKDSVGDCERSLGSYRSTVIQFQSKLKEVKTIVGQYFMPTAQKVMRFMTDGVIRMRGVIVKITEITDKAGGLERVLKLIIVTGGAIYAALNFPKIVQGLKNVLAVITHINLKAVAIVAVIVLMVLLIDDIINFIKGNGSVIGDLLGKAGIDVEATRQAIISAWTSIKGFLSQVWKTISGLAKTIFGALGSWWNENGSSVLNSFMNIWQGIKNLAVALWTALSGAATKIFGALQAFWERWGGTIMAVFGTVWNTIVSLIGPVLDALASIIDFLANVFTGNWQGAWQSIKDFAAAIWNALVNIINGAWTIISTVWSAVVEFFAGIFQNIWNAIVEKVTGIKNSIVEGFQAAIDWIKALPGEALQWGADIVDSIVSGITGAVGKVGDAVKGVASKIRSFLGFSEPEDGPLSNFHTYMPDMMALMSKGIKEGKGKVKTALELVTGDMKAILQNQAPAPSTVANTSYSNNSSRVVNQTNEFNQHFHGDKSFQKEAAPAMDRAAHDTTDQLARALAFAR